MALNASELAARLTSEQISAWNSRSVSETNVILTELFPVVSPAPELIADLDETFEAPLSEFDDLDEPGIGDRVSGIGTANHLPDTRKWDDTDQVLKEAFLAGSEEAFIRLYAKYEVALLFYCKRMLKNDWMAEDAFQEIWTHVFELRKRPGVTILHFRGLLFRSARNMCMNIIRVQKPMVSASEDRDDLTIVEPMSGEASSREMQDLMLKALAKLPFDQRETFVLHEYSGFTYAEIAEMKDTTVQAVKVRACRARLRLRKFIQGWLGLGETDDPVSYI